MNKANFFTSKEIKPSGWLKQQLMIQAEGLSGNLDKIWPDVKDSAWIGGDREGWERVPYWLDGFIPLAYLLENEDMIARAKKYIDALLKQQKASGWICPCRDDEIPSYDTWAVQLITKVLVVYYECSEDERIPTVIYNVLKNYYELLSEEKIKLFDWGKYRWFECFVAINFLLKHYNENWIFDLAKLLRDQGIDYSELTELWKRPLNKWTMDTHIVNLVMMLKAEAISCEVLGEKYTDCAESLRSILDKYNGTPVGLFTGDECLSGNSPIQGTELCAVVEQMYSYELLYAYTGNSKWLEYLELLAFNALPAAISDDMWAHQYVQMSNQIACERFPGRSLFRTNNSEAHLFGLEPHYGCCTANFNQGWPKLALSTYMYSGDTIISTIPIPSELKTEDIHIKLASEYPFKNELKYEIESLKDFQFVIRIPSFACNLKVNGKEVGKYNELKFDIMSGEKMEIHITFEVEASWIDRPFNLKCMKYGSLIFSVPISYKKKMYEYEKDGVERKYPYCDYEYLGESAWNFAYCSKDIEIVENDIADIPFSSSKPPIIAKAKVVKIDWGLEEGFEKVCAKIPLEVVPKADREEIELYPYGCAKLRMTELPQIELE